VCDGHLYDLKRAAEYLLLFLLAGELQSELYFLVGESSLNRRFIGINPPIDIKLTLIQSK